MARRMRIRHKLTLGLFLVVAVLAVPLAGTVYGMLDYRASMKAVAGKDQEILAAEDLRQRVALLHKQTANLKDREEAIAACQMALTKYREALRQTELAGYDPNTKEEEEHVRLLTGLFARMTVEAQKVPEPTMDGISEKEMADLLNEATKGVAGLLSTLHKDIQSWREASRARDRLILTSVAISAGVGLILVLLQSRKTHQALTDPIRDLHAKALQLAEGQFDGHITVESGDEIQDLAEAFNHMGDRLKVIYGDLEHQVNERSRQLVRSESLAGVGFLAAGVAHEINNPLASIAFCSEALDSRLRDLLAGMRGQKEVENVHRYLKMIQEEAFRCKEITQKLLEFSRVGERPRQWTFLAELVQGVIDMVHLHQNYRGRSIRFEARQQPCLLINDQEIKSVVLNLVANALESMDEGGTLTIVLDVAGGEAVLYFQDTGCGMPPEVLENIFEPFFSRSRTGKGIGLGLSISHRIITQHGGDITAASAGPDRGSTFTVRLPISDGQPAVGGPPERAAA